MKSRLLRAFGRAQRPVAWSVLALAPVVLAGVIFDVVQTGDAKLATIIGALVLVNDAFASVMAVENELDSEAAARVDDEDDG